MTSAPTEQWNIQYDKPTRAKNKRHKKKNARHHIYHETISLLYYFESVYKFITLYNE